MFNTSGFMSQIKNLKNVLMDVKFPFKFPSRMHMQLLPTWARMFQETSGFSKNTFELRLREG